MSEIVSDSCRTALDDALSLVNDTNVESIAAALVDIVARVSPSATCAVFVLDDAMAWTPGHDVEAAPPSCDPFAIDMDATTDFIVGSDGRGEWLVMHQGMAVGCVCVVVDDDDTRSALQAHAAVLWTHLGAALSNAGMYKTLENLVESEMQTSVERELQMQLVLDNMNDALVMVDLEGRLDGVRSAKLEEWLGPIEEGQSICDYLFDDDNEQAQFNMGFEEIVDDILPFALTCEQALRAFERDGRHFSISYEQVHKEEAFVGLVLTIRDVTVEVASREAEVSRKEMMGALQHLLKDRSLFFSFVDNTTDDIAELGSLQGDEAALRHALHTLKGNTAIMGFVRFPQAVHDVESDLDDGVAVDDSSFAQLQATWSKSLTPFEELRDGDVEEYVRVRIAELSQWMDDDDITLEELRLAMRRWQWTEASASLTAMASSAQRLAQRMCKQLNVFVDGGCARIPPHYDGIFKECVHLVRNAIDHGLERADERLAAGKEESGSLSLTAVEDDAGLRLTVADDGRGVDWEAIAQKASKLGLPHDDDAALQQAFFADQLSTRDTVTDISGRGVGTAAVAEAAVRAGGRIWVESERGKGTSVHVFLPHVSLAMAENDDQVAPHSQVVSHSA